MPAPNLPEIPPGPADVIYPRRALSRLALSSAAAETAETAIGHVPTITDGDAYEVVVYAARLAASARYVLTRAVVHAREIGGTWAEIAEALSITEQDAQERYREEIERWEDALDRPWERSRAFLSSRMPQGCSDPAWTADYLDRWCTRHSHETDAARSFAKQDGIEDRMVSANLPKHTTLTEMNRELRVAARLMKAGTPQTDPEWVAHRQRRAELHARIDAEAELRIDAELRGEITP